MTKIELATIVAQTTGVQVQDVISVLEKTTETITKSVAAGEPVYMRGFGSFVPKLRAEKLARNISAGTSVTVPARVIASFKPSPAFSEKVTKGHRNDRKVA